MGILGGEDVVIFDGTGFEQAFDGSDVGLAGLDVDAFTLLPNGRMLLSVSAPAPIPGLGEVDDSDIVRFSPASLGSTTSGVFKMYLDGSDVNLGRPSEDVDALDVLDDGTVAISTTGSVAVPGVRGQDEDLLSFAPSSRGWKTAGAWSIYLDGSDVDLDTTGGEDVDAATVTDAGAIWLSTRADFAVPGITGADEDVVACVAARVGRTTRCTYLSVLVLDGSDWGLVAENVDGVWSP
jgi:hypothetical protein